MPLLPAILGKSLHRRLDQPQAAVIAVQADVADQVVDRREAAFVLAAGDQLQLVRLGQSVVSAQKLRTMTDSVLPK